MSDKLPKVSIAVVGVVIAQIGGFIWWTAQQASTISNLEETVNILTVENNATDKTNLIRDVQRNTDHLQEIIDILSEFYEDMEDGDNEIWEDIDMINEDMGGMASHMMEIIKLQSRIAILEKTVEFTVTMGCSYGPINNSCRIKTGLAAGKTVAGLSKQIGQFFDATDQAKKTLQKKGISSKSANATALDRWAKVRQAAEAEEELKEWITQTYGRSKYLELAENRREVLQRSEKPKPGGVMLFKDKNL